MEHPRAEKVAVVDEVRERLEGSDGAIVTEYRGMTVAEMQDLRRAIVASGGDYKVYKNTLVRLAIAETKNADLAELLVGPTAIAFVRGDVSAAAKALRDFAKSSPALVLKGGVIDGALLRASDLSALADLPSREVLLSQVAGVIAAPMRNLAGLFKAVPQSLAYGLAALRDQMPAAPEDAAPAAQVTTDDAEAETPAAQVAEADTTEAPAPEATSAEVADTTDDTAAEAPVAEADDTTEAAAAPAEEPETPAAEEAPAE